MDKSLKKNGQSHTLEYEINVPARLLISDIFSHRYALISDGTFIDIGIFRKFHNNSNNRNRDIDVSVKFFSLKLY